MKKGEIWEAPIAGMIAVVAILLNSACNSGPGPAQSADVIYIGGDIITMNDKQPTAEAVAV